MSKTKKAGKRSSGRRKSTTAGLRAVLRATMRSRAAASPAAAAPGAAAAPKLVTFTCSSPACLVGMTSGPLNFAFSGSGAASFPIGNSPIFFRVQGPRAPVTITAQGGTLNPPIAGTPSFGGMTTLTVV